MSEGGASSSLIRMTRQQSRGTISNRPSEVDHSVTFAGAKSKSPRLRPKKEPSAREKAIEFAKNVPKPKPKKEVEKKEEIMAGSPKKEEFDKLEAKHEMYVGELARLKKDYQHFMEF